MYLKSLSSFLFLISMRLQALLDHFGYEVAFLKDWHMETWFNQKKFDSWFATLRNNRRLKAIMPLLHEISSDDSDDDGGDSSNLPPPTSSGGDGNAPGLLERILVIPALLKRMVKFQAPQIL